jgi:hypothetical protein
VTVIQMTIAAADTVYGQHNTQTRIASDTADNVLWDKYTNSDRGSQDAETTAALSRITFSTRATTTPLHTLADLVPKEDSSASQSMSVIVVLGRSRRLAVESHAAELRKIMTETGSTFSSSVSKTLGDVGAALVAKSTPASLLIMQAHTGSL